MKNRTEEMQELRGVESDIIKMKKTKKEEKYIGGGWGGKGAGKGKNR